MISKGEMGNRASHPPFDPVSDGSAPIRRRSMVVGNATAVILHESARYCSQQMSSRSAFPFPACHRDQLGQIHEVPISGGGQNLSDTAVVATFVVEACECGALCPY